MAINELLRQPKYGPKRGKQFRLPVSGGFSEASHRPANIRQTHEYRNTRPSVRLVTLGWHAEGWENKPGDWIEKIQNMLMDEGYDFVPANRILNTLNTKGDGLDEHIQICNGYNWYILESVWKTLAAIVVTKNMFWDYLGFRKVARPGQVFAAAFFCRSGNHRSVAMCHLVKCVFLDMLRNSGSDDVSVIQWDRSKEKGHWDKFCGERCEHCKRSTDNDAWIAEKFRRVTAEVYDRQ